MKSVVIWALIAMFAWAWWWYPRTEEKMRRAQRRWRKKHP